MHLPREFILHGHTIKVNIREISKDNNFGEYDDVREEINIYRKVKQGGVEVPLSEVQIHHTFFHELIHAFQWHAKGEYNEAEAQTYAGLLLEFFKTSGVKIDPRVVYESITEDTYDE